MRAWAHPCRCSSSRQESGCGSRPSTYPSSPAPSLARTSGCAAPIVHACGVSGYAPAQAAHTRCPLHLRVGGGRGCAGARCGAALGPACLLGLRPRQARPPGSFARRGHSLRSNGFRPPVRARPHGVGYGSTLRWRLCRALPWPMRLRRYAHAVPFGAHASTRGRVLDCIEKGREEGPCLQGSLTEREYPVSTM
jgi:hypothetical protein